MNLSRRNFLGLTIGGVAAAAAVRSFPFRVFSFPSEIKICGEDFLVNPWLRQINGTLFFRQSFAHDWTPVAKLKNLDFTLEPDRLRL